MVSSVMTLPQGGRAAHCLGQIWELDVFDESAFCGVQAAVPHRRHVRRYIAYVDRHGCAPSVATDAALSRYSRSEVQRSKKLPLLHELRAGAPSHIERYGKAQPSVRRVGSR